jgi:ABC-type transport system involved in multi-copper enzyme maturation permease subunit
MAAGSVVVLGAIRFPNWVEPLWTVAVGVVVALMSLWLLALVLRRLAPKVAAIMRTTSKEAMAQPVFYVIVAIGVFVLLLMPFVSYNTLGEDVKVLKMDGLTIIKVLAIILALWTASISISEEIEGRTALTLLSKPVGRRQLIVGKLLGILWTVAVLFIVLGAVFLSTVSYKVHYDARETSHPEPTAADCAREIEHIAPGLALGFMAAAIMAAMSVAISTRLPMLPNLIICLSIYMLGHLIPRLINSSVGEFEPVQFVGRLLAAVLPVLDHFSMETAISADQMVPWSYIGVAAVYCLLYSGVAMLLALILFEDRDLA